MINYERKKSAERVAYIVEMRNVYNALSNKRRKKNI
jgi:hypothetical protein